MNNASQTILNYLVQNRIIDENTTKEIKNIISNEDKLFGNILIENGYFTEEDLLFLLIEFYKKGVITLDDITTEFNITNESFLKALANESGFEYVDLDNIDLDYKSASKISVTNLRKFGILPIKEDDINVYVAFKNVLDINSQEGSQRLYNKKILKPIVVDPYLLEKYLTKLELAQSIKGLISEIRKELSSSAISGDSNEDSSGILKLIEVILKTAIIARASDIHIESTENNCIVRSRVDGMLTESFIFDKDIFPPLTSRMKLLSNMDIAEKRKPQDGRFSATVMGKEYDFRISTLPILSGESIVLRILDKSKVVIKLENLGMHPDNFKKFETAMKAPYGIVFVTGPTGSGKTTTLYAALNAIKSIETKIITVEDPVEYQLNLTQQTQVNEKAGLTFATALRSILRQDPDIIMIGEVRDQETLRIAIQAALTGHLVFSTLHTNDAISAVTRVLDMGIESYLISGSLVAIEAQRLVRKLCPSCRLKTTISDNIYEKIRDFLPENFTFYKAAGCEKCLQTGYLGREMISEILLISEAISSLIARGATKDEIRMQAHKEGYIDMYKDGIIRAAKGITSIEEVLRVVKS